MYTIKVMYETGNSFGSSDDSCQVGLFETVSEAQNACSAIIEHYKVFKDRSTPGSKKNLEQYKWYNPEVEFPEYSIKLHNQSIEAVWIGYFERLISLHIEIYQTEENQVDFYLN